MTMKQKHMNIHDLYTIEHSLNNGDSFKYIASLIHKDCTTVSKFVRRNLTIKNTGAYGRIFNDCSLRHHCKRYALCSSCSHKPDFSCRNCLHCHLNCKDYHKEICPKISKPPYVCNPCKQRRSCTLTKHFFSASDAYHMTKKRLSEAHSGMILSSQDIDRLNAIFVPGIQEHNQSIHHIYIHNKDSIMLSERTIYKDIFHYLYETLGKDVFCSLFPVILTDNGSEFSDPKSLEFDCEGKQRTNIFYCDAGRPDQKGSCEVNHTLIRRILPKGISFDE